MRKRVKRIVSGKGKKAAKARSLYGKIASGARQQQRLHRIFERNFFSPGFKSQRLIEEARKFRGSKRQMIELKEYAKRLAGKRDWVLQRFRVWGIGSEHMGKAIERTPSGLSARVLLCNLTGWNSLGGKVEMVPTKNLLAFRVEPSSFRKIVRREQPRTKKAKVFVVEGNKTTVIITPDLERIKKYFAHEKQHAITANLPINRELYWDKKARVNQRALRQSFVSTNLKLGARKLGRELLDELIANMVEGELGFFEKKHRHYYLADSSRDYLDPKTAASFMHNKGRHKERLLKATAQSIKAVKKALAAKVTDPQGREKKIIRRKQLAGLLANIRDIEKVPKRLPVLVEMRKNKLKKRTAIKGVTQ